MFWTGCWVVEESFYTKLAEKDEDVKRLPGSSANSRSKEASMFESVKLRAMSVKSKVSVVANAAKDAASGELDGEHRL